MEISKIVKNKRWLRKSKRIVGNCLSIHKKSMILDCPCLKCRYFGLIDCRYEYKPLSGNFKYMRDALKGKPYYRYTKNNELIRVI